MKTMLQYFADEMLPAFGISEKVKAYAPTEHVHVEIKKGLQDFNLVMEDDSIAHFEFQSTNGGRRDLRRFRSYEADTSYQLEKPVTTYVLFSGKIRRPMTKIAEGINVYKIRPIIMKKQNADLILRKLQKKVSNGQPLTRQDLAVLPLLPIMGGKSSLLSRIKDAFSFTASATHVSKEDIAKIEAVVYAMATKFLSKEELTSIRKVVTMTYLGQLIYEDGFTEGHNEGRNEGRNLHLKEQIVRKLKKGKLKSEIAKELEEDEETISILIDEISAESN